MSKNKTKFTPCELYTLVIPANEIAEIKCVFKLDHTSINEYEHQAITHARQAIEGIEGYAYIPSLMEFILNKVPPHK
ncbi:hypothetical protein KO525_13970 [Psychrosphaera sp. B3R10]|uniref:hypothetical protein n=1 Tax=unclassified Psychrosphaera TaxID=2641570 RepID=UPI001C08CF5B|nr:MULTISPECIES: hypothetical protein [unclassified Psychrosphaera]MBU2883415.1 hypothetical protein [Psychrosphaera sp. I2R16]MBU2990491.1 hypothetical protein [Psychrosphaera sp. B3R10]MDO6719034.1 hypothetical protein [Psychrosphaera sp. 1_MG-2023]